MKNSFLNTFQFFCHKAPWLEIIAEGFGCDGLKSVFFSSDIWGISCLLFCNCTAASHDLTQWINNQVMQLHWGKLKRCFPSFVVTPWWSDRIGLWMSLVWLQDGDSTCEVTVSTWRICPSRWGGSNLWLVGILEQLLNSFSRSYFILFCPACAFQLAFQRANQHPYIISSGSICMKNKM